MRNARSLLALFLCLGLAASPAAPQSPPADPEMAAGVQQLEEGNFEAAVLTFDRVVRKLAGAGRTADLARADVYLGMAYLGLGQETTARTQFREALRQSPDMTLNADDFPPHVLQLFEDVRREVRPKPAGSPAPPTTAPPAAPAEKKGSRKGLFILLGGGAAAAGIAAAAGGGGGAGGSATTVAPTTAPGSPTTAPGTTMPGATPTPSPGATPTPTPPATTTPASTTTTTTQPPSCTPSTPTLSISPPVPTGGTITLTCDVPGATSSCPSRVDFSARNQTTGNRIDLGSVESAPYTVDWDSSSAPKGAYGLTCTAIGSTNATSNTVLVTIITAAPTLVGSEMGLETDLAVAGGRGQVVVGSAAVLFVGPGPSIGRVAASHGETRIEAHLVTADGRPGTWRFRVAGAGGALRVIAGDVALVTEDVVVFRLAGRPGERVVFSVGR